MPWIINFIKPRNICGAFLISTFLLSYSLTQAQDSSWSLFTEFDSLSYSESFSIAEIIDSDDIEGLGFSDGGSDVFTHNNVAIGLRKRGWELAVLTRLDSYVNYTADTAQIILANEIDDEVSNGNFNIDLRANHSESLGLRLGYKHEINPNVSVTGRISGLVASEIIDGSLSGDLAFLDTDIEGELLLDYVFSQDIAFDREFESSEGYGFSIDGILNWKVNEKVELEFGAYDFVNRIWFDDITRTRADATTAVARTMDNGILIVRPTLTGENLFDPVTQKLRPRYDAKLNYALSNRWQLSQDLFMTGGNYLTQSEAVYTVNSDLELGANYEWISQALGISIHWKTFKFGFATDSLNINKARYAKLHLGLDIEF